MGVAAHTFNQVDLCFPSVIFRVLWCPTAVGVGGRDNTSRFLGSRWAYETHGTSSWVKDLPRFKCVRKGKLGVGNKWCNIFLISDALDICWSIQAWRQAEGFLGRNKTTGAPHLKCSAASWFTVFFSPSSYSLWSLLFSSKGMGYSESMARLSQAPTSLLITSSFHIPRSAHVPAQAIGTRPTLIHGQAKPLCPHHISDTEQKKLSSYEKHNLLICWFVGLFRLLF